MVYEKLLKIQSELIAPKNMHNKFGNYNYRNLEGICESAKPLLKELKCVLYFEDDIVQTGDRYYTEATAILVDTEDGSKITCKAKAREEETKKGMDASQITGSSSSYARKYAVAGLFLLDDNKDADSNELHEQIKNTPSREEVGKLKISSVKAQALRKKMASMNVPETKALIYYKVESLEELTEEQHAEIIAQLDGSNAGNNSKHN